MKDSTNEISSKYIFTQYSIMISTNFYSQGCRNPIIRDKNSLYYILAKGVENEVLARKPVENQRFYG